MSDNPSTCEMVISAIHNQNAVLLLGQYFLVSDNIPAVFNPFLPEDIRHYAEINRVDVFLLLSREMIEASRSRYQWQELILVPSVRHLDAESTKNLLRHLLKKHWYEYSQLPESRFFLDAVSNYKNFVLCESQIVDCIKQLEQAGIIEFDDDDSFRGIGQIITGTGHGKILLEICVQGDNLPDF